MKTKLFTLCLAALLIGSLSFANIRRVGYTGTPKTGIDYPDFTSAHDASANNDTIQIYGSIGGYYITKPLVIIGFGYNFDVNTGLQAIGTDAPSSATLYFLPGSNGSSVSGVSGSFGIGDQNGTQTLVSNITFQRCNGTFNFYNNEGYGPISNVKIISSVITGGGMIWSGVNDYPVTNLQVYNCIFGYGGGMTLYKTSTTASFINCVMPSPNYIGQYALPLNDASVLVKNCILGGAGASTNINTVFESNFFYEAQPAPLPPGSNNRWSQDWSVIFNRLSGSDNASYLGDAAFDEDWYILKSGSPAIAGGFKADGTTATDCGIYGGETAYKYKLSGVPAVPAIYKLTAPNSAASANPYNVTISVRSNN